MVIAKCPHCEGPLPYLVEFQGREAFCTGCGRHFVLDGSAALPSDNREVLVLDLDGQKTNEKAESTKPKET